MTLEFIVFWVVLLWLRRRARKKLDRAWEANRRLLEIYENLDDNRQPRLRLEK